MASNVESVSMISRNHEREINNEEYSRFTKAIPITPLRILLHIDFVFTTFYIVEDEDQLSLRSWFSFNPSMDN